MSYRISYNDTTAPALKKWRNEESERVEIFASEYEALKRARELLDEGEVHGVTMTDDSGSVLGGFRLQLRLGFSPVE
jgi:hypothetical protein